MCYEFSFSFCLFLFLLIKQLSCCSTLRLFATSSEDYSVKIWNCDNQLVREMSFDESLCGVCFANSRGDILVGFQSQISLVTIFNYLPLSYLEILSKMHFDNDPFEDHVQFDDLLKFWYDPARVPRMPLEASKRRPLEPPEVKRLKKKRKVGEPAGWLKVLRSSLEDKASPSYNRRSLCVLCCMAGNGHVQFITGIEIVIFFPHTFSKTLACSVFSDAGKILRPVTKRQMQMCIPTTKRLMPSITEENTYRLNQYIHEVSLLFSSS